MFKRLGYALEALELNLPEVHSACRERISAGISSLDPNGPSGGRIVSSWNLRVNVTLSSEEPS